MKTLNLWALIGTLICCLIPMTASAGRYNDLSPDDYLKIFNGDSRQDMAKASETLAWAGLSDAKLFDVIEARLLADLPKTPKDKAMMDYAGWLTKALSFSGNPKYRSTLERIAKTAPNKKNRAWAKKALPVLDKHTTLNPLIAPNAWPQHTHPNLQQRLLTMLKSDNLELIRTAAKRIYYPNSRNPELLSAVNNAILRNFKNEKRHKLHTDSMAWLCKTIANAQSSKHRSTVELVAQSAPSKKLRGYAKKYMKKYYF